MVVVGYTDPLLQDVHPAPGAEGKMLPGPEVQANAIATVRDGFPVESPSRALEVLLIAVLSLVGPVTGGWLPPARNLALAALALAGFLVAATLAFRSGSLVAVTYPVLGLVLGAAGAVGANYLNEARERRRTRSAFSRFVPERVMEEAIERQAGDLRAGGSAITATVMFSDLRGFTAFSESLPPERVIEVLNRYLGEMSDAITDHGGTIIDYMGDGIMAVFGAPVAATDHADRALDAAREMLAVRLLSFNDWLRAKHLGDGFRMGIGLNSGPVIAGNVGSERRVGYTAIGDTTNTASRLEAMTKGTPHQLFLAESTRSLLTHEPPGLVFVDELALRGRQGAIRVWSLAEVGVVAN